MTCWWRDRWRTISSKVGTSRSDPAVDRDRPSGPRTHSIGPLMQRSRSRSPRFARVLHQRESICRAVAAIDSRRPARMRFRLSVSIEAASGLRHRTVSPPIYGFPAMRCSGGPMASDALGGTRRRDVREDPMIDRRAFFVRLFGAAAAVNAVATTSVDTAAGVPSWCLVISKDDPHNVQKSRRYHALRALARDMEGRDEALIIGASGDDRQRL